MATTEYSTHIVIELNKNMHRGYYPYQEALIMITLYLCS